MVVAKAKALGLDTLAQSVSIGYLIVFLIVLGVVLWRNKTTKAKLIGGIVTVGAFALLPYWLLVYKSPAETVAIAKQEAAGAEWKAKYDAAKPIFEKLCKEQSQPIIKRTVEDVEGVLLLRVRGGSYKTRHRDTADQMWAGAGNAQLPYGDLYMTKFLQDRKLDDEYGNKIRNSVGAANHRRGFRFIDVRDPTTSVLSRITATSVPSRGNAKSTEIELVRIPLKEKTARYAVDLIEDLDPDLRKHWIAGTTIRVIDTKTNEVLGEQSWWNWDPSFGNTSGGRSPWLTGKVCGEGAGRSETGHLFVDSILKAKQGN
jgi:hypothetical protein